MRVILSMATSLNGLVARENGEEDWLPEAGWDEFLVEAKRYDNIVMGRETYELVNKYYEHETFGQIEVAHKLVVSRADELGLPVGYAHVKSPQAAIGYLNDKGANSLFLIGGGKLNSSFLSEGLVDEVHLTVNPYILGKGRSFVSPLDFEMPLELLYVRNLSGDRLSVGYTVQKPIREAA